MICTDIFLTFRRGAAQSRVSGQTDGKSFMTLSAVPRAGLMPWAKRDVTHMTKRPIHQIDSPPPIVGAWPLCSDFASAASPAGVETDGAHPNPRNAAALATSGSVKSWSS